MLKNLDPRKIFIFSAGAIVIILLIGHYFIGFNYYRIVIKNLQKEVSTTQTIDANLETICDENDSLRNALRELSFVKAQLRMSKNDSAGLVIDIPNNLVSVQIKGVNVFNTKIKDQELDFILQELGIHAYQYLYGNPLKIQDERANIEREPIVHIIAPVDTAAARLAPKHQPDTTLMATVHLDFGLDKNINLIITGFEVPSASRWFREKVQFVYDQFSITRKMIPAIFNDEVTDYQHHIHLWVDNHDARIIYRALQSNSQVVIRY